MGSQGVEEGEEGLICCHLCDLIVPNGLGMIILAYCIYFFLVLFLVGMVGYTTCGYR